MNWWALTWAALGEGTLIGLVWTVTSLLLLAGLIGTVVPVLPGPALIFLGALFHFLALEYGVGVDSGISWPGFSILLVMVMLTQALEMFSSAMGARYFGSTRWGVWGAILGGVVGIFFGIPGIFIGPVVGALAFEMILARRQWRPAAKSTWGTLLGTTAGLVLKVGMGLLMTGYFLLDVLLLRW